MRRIAPHQTSSSGSMTMARAQSAESCISQSSSAEISFGAPSACISRSNASLFCSKRRLDLTPSIKRPGSRLWMNDDVKVIQQCRAPYASLICCLSRFHILVATTQMNLSSRIHLRRAFKVSPLPLLEAQGARRQNNMSLRRTARKAQNFFRLGHARITGEL